MDYPRVTEILKPYTHFENVPAQVLQRAAERGTTVHALCAGIAKGAWVPDAMIPEECSKYVESFKLWTQAQVKKFVVIEKRYAHDIRKFTGQIDYVVEATDGKNYLVDIKTSSRPQKTYPVQLAAYDMLLRYDGMHTDGAMLVYLSKDGEFPDVDMLESLEAERYVFTAALDCWHYFNKRKKNVGKCTDENEPEHPPTHTRDNV